MFHQKISHDSIFHGRKNRPYRSGDFFLRQHGSGFGNLGLEQGSGRLFLGICPSIFLGGGRGSRKLGTKCISKMFTLMLQNTHPYKSSNNKIPSKLGHRFYGRNLLSAPHRSLVHNDWLQETSPPALQQR